MEETQKTPSSAIPEVRSDLPGAASWSAIELSRLARLRPDQVTASISLQATRDLIVILKDDYSFNSPQRTMAVASSRLELMDQTLQRHKFEAGPNFDSLLSLIQAIQTDLEAICDSPSEFLQMKSTRVRELADICYTLAELSALGSVPPEAYKNDRKIEQSWTF